MSDEMNVKISEIKAKFIQKEAKLVDKYFGNNDGKISKEEGAKLASILSGDLEKKGNQKKLAKESDEVKSIFGLNVSTPIESTKPAQVKQVSVVEQIEETSKKSANKTLEQAAVAQAVVYKSKETETVKIEADEVKTEAPKKTFKTPFEEVKARFLEVMEYDSENNTSNGTTAKEAYHAVKKEFKGKGKEYKKAIDDLHDYAKHGFVNMRAQKTRAAVQAFDSQGRLINEDNLKYESSRDVLKRERELTKENNNGVTDRWAKRALRNRNTSGTNNFVRYITGHDSAGKIDDKAVAAGNKSLNIRENKTFTKEELTKALGKNNPLLQPYTDTKGNTYDNVLVATGLMTVENGKYNVKELSKVIGGAIGSDNTLNDHDNHNESEIQSVLNRLYQALRANGSGEFKTSELKDSQVRDLVKFLGYEDDRSRLLVQRVWRNVWKEAGKGAIAGAAGGAANTSIIKFDTHSKQEVNIDLTGYTAEQKADFLKGIQLENDLLDVPVQTVDANGIVNTTFRNISETSTGIHILQETMSNVKITRILKAITYGALAGAGTGAMLGALETIGSHAREKEILGMVFDCDTTYEEIVDTIDNAYSDKQLSPAMKEALKKVAEFGIVKEYDKETGVWKAVLDENCQTKFDFCKFIEAYNDARGNKILNAAEARSAARTADKNNKLVIPECDPVVDDVCKDGKCDPTVGDKAYKIPPHAWNRKGGETWKAIVEAKYPCLVEELAKKGIDIYSKNGAIKAMQRALATDENGKFHADEYRRIISGDIPKHLDFPDEINITIGDRTVTCKYEDNEVKRVSQKKLHAGGSIKSNNGRYGYGRKGNNKTYTDSCHPAITGEGKTEAEAKADFNRKVAEANARAKANK